ncbi:hypothetical protein ACFFIO_07860 [Citricoccus parietis]|uniref:Apea-like HEPN domain-containing protein n=1 Tax=Citricoccus parietis TaxID=592307 RepID=A0ABV6F505_9MICC
MSGEYGSYIEDRGLNEHSDGDSVVDLEIGHLTPYIEHAKLGGMSSLPLDDGRGVYPLKGRPRLPSDSGTALLRHLMRAFLEVHKDMQVTMSRRQGRISETAFSVQELHSRDMDLPASFALIPLKGDQLAFGLIAEDERRADEGREIWNGPLDKALERLEAMLSFEWRAVIAPVTDYSPPAALDHEYLLGGLHLVPNGRPYARLKRAMPRGMLQGGEVELLHPVIVTGSANSHDWGTARVDADEQVVRLCTALTVATGEYWEVLESSQMREYAEPIPAAEIEFLDGEITQDWAPPTLLSAMPIGDEAYVRIAEDDAYGALCSALYNACAVEHTSPSLAHVAFVGILETIGGQWVELDTCKTCGSQKGSAKRFRRALKEAFPHWSNRERKPLEQQYEQRSKTAHEGRLFAGEDRLSRVMDFFQSDPTDEFKFQGVMPIKMAAIELLRDHAMPRFEMEYPQEAGEADEHPA